MGRKAAGGIRHGKKSRRRDPSQEEKLQEGSVAGRKLPREALGQRRDLEG